MPDSKSKNRYPELDALRGLAAMLVLFFHFTWGNDGAGFVFRYGSTGVDFFFIISGFVIFMSLNAVKTGKEFVINRVSRLYPTYWACVTLTYILICIYYQVVTVDFEKLVFTDYLINLSMIQFYFQVPNVDQAYWTMIIELIFYICILILFYFKLFKKINAIGLAASLVSAGLANFARNETVDFIFRWIPFLPYIPLFFSGIVFFQLYHKQESVFKNYLLLMVSFICQIALLSITGREVFLNHYEYGGMLLLYYVFFTLFVNGKLKFIVSKFTVFMGAISYALYLTHQFISVNILLPFFVDKLKLNFWVVCCFIALPIVVLIGAAITYGIEKPLGQKMKTKLRNVFNVDTPGLIN